MIEPFLILHKVRGAPAFDIAQKVECSVCDGTLIKVVGNHFGEACDNCESGFWWIIPTSGHRAYPFDSQPLNHVGRNAFVIPTIQLDNVTDEPAWASWPDHYAVSQARSRLATAASDILSLMGIGKAKPAEPVKKRIIP